MDPNQLQQYTQTLNSAIEATNNPEQAEQAYNQVQERL